jgi:uncharacterized membrane protein YoaT (DUF817 family)
MELASRCGSNRNNDHYLKHIGMPCYSGYLVASVRSLITVKARQQIALSRNRSFYWGAVKKILVCCGKDIVYEGDI